MNKLDNKNFGRGCQLAVWGLLLVLVAVVVHSCQLSQLGRTKKPLDAEVAIPLEGGYLRGVLPNGLRYSIRENDRIKDQMLMYLAINAGSLQEEDDQRGLAHFVEHMAFNGSEHFPGNSLIEFARENGMNFGAHLNAYTSFEETVYNFKLPSTDEEVLDKSLLVLYDWLNGLLIEDQEVEKERGIVLSERRDRLGFSERFINAWIPVLLEGSRFGERLPIGLKEVIEQAPPQRLRDFYEKWYNTQNAMVVLVGDFDAKAMEQRLERLLGTIPSRGQQVSSGLQRSWENVPIRQADANGQPNIKALQLQDDEAPSTLVSISLKAPRDAVATTVGQLRQILIHKLLSAIVNRRFSDIAQQRSDTVANMDYYTSTNGNVEFYHFDATGQTGQLAAAYAELLLSLAQLKQYGILQSEMDWALAALHSEIESNYNSLKERENIELAIHEVNQFLGSAYNYDTAWVYRNFDRLVGPITLADLNDTLAKTLQIQDVTLLSLGKDLAELPTEQQLRTGYLGLNQLEVTAPQELQDLPDQLLQTKPRAGRIVKEQRLKQTGFVHWTLSNGVEVYFKRTEFEANQFEYDAFRPEYPIGTLLLGNRFGPGSVVSDLLSEVVSASGFAPLSPEQYERYMDYKTIGNNWIFAPYYIGQAGGGDKEDIQELFQQIYLSFTAPQFSQKLIDRAVETLRTNYVNTLADPESHFSLLQSEHRYQNDTRFVLPRNLPKSYSSSNLQKAFRNLVPSAQGFCFVFVGDIPKSELKNYVKRYLASLPTKKPFITQETKRKLYEKGGVKEYFLGQENKAVSRLVWDSLLDSVQLPPPKETYRIDLITSLLSNLLDIQLTKVLREKLGKTYSPYGWVAFTSMPYRASMTVGYSSAPEDVAELDATVEQLLESLRQGDIDGDEFEKAKGQLSKSSVDSRQQNWFWGARLIELLEQGYPDIDEGLSEAKFREVLASISKQDLADFLQQYVPPQRKVRYTMLPQKSDK